MAKASVVLIILGILLLAYAILGAFVGNPMIFSYVRPIKPSTGIALANSMLILGLLAKICKKA